MRRAFDAGVPVGASKVFVTARGTLSLGDQFDERFRRTVRTAEFRRVDDGEPVPPLRNAELLQWAGNCLVVTGVEEVTMDHSARPRLYAQSWQLVPEPYVELQRMTMQWSRLIDRLRQVGVHVEIRPGGEISIPGETRPD
jgi:hypothetical protein